MMAETTINQNVIIQEVNDSTITLSINGEVSEIKNQLAELKTLLQKYQTPNIQYADKIYNIAHIDEANFGFLTGKKSFNEQFTKILITSIAPYKTSAQKLLDYIKQNNIENWECISQTSNKAKEILAYSFVGVIGIQISMLIAIGKEDFSEAKQRKYLEKSLQIVKWTLDLLNFTLISKIWDIIYNQPINFTETEQKRIRQLLVGGFELTVIDRYSLFQTLLAFCKNHQIALPISELENWTNNDAEVYQSCQFFQTLEGKLEKVQYNLLDCSDAEVKLSLFLKNFAFLVLYKMASIKQIQYQLERHVSPKYMHYYASLGVDSKTNSDANAEKVNYSDSTVYSDSVLIYKEDDYIKGVNLVPFVIDYNDLIFESRSRITFFKEKDLIDSCLTFVFLDDNSNIKIERKNILSANSDTINEIMMDNKKRKILNLDKIINLFDSICQSFLGEVPQSLDDI